jgi:HK97 family phage major capsid protein
MKKKHVFGILIAVTLAALSPFALAAIASPPDLLLGLQHALASTDSTWLSYAGLAIGNIKLKELRDQRGKLIHDARAILDKADEEKRALTEAEDKTYKEVFGKADELRTRIEREEQLAEAERTAAEQSLRGKPGNENPEGQRTAGKRGSDEYRAAFDRFIASGRTALSESEIRALQADSDSGGGFMVASEQFVDTLIKGVDDMVFIRAKATKYRVESAGSLGAPYLAADPDDANWTAEILTGSEDSTMSFGKRSLTPHPLAKRIKVSNKLMRMNAGMGNLVANRLAYKFGISQEKGFMTGSGAAQPLGIFTASNDGIPTSRDVSTGNAATAPTFDGLIAAKFALKGNYWNKAEWIFHRDVLAVIAKLKNGEGDYIWRESVRAGEPDRLLNLAVNMSEYAPSTLTASQYVGALGDYSQYWIADALDLQVQRLTELYAETNQMGFIGRLESDGMPVLAEAFVRVKLAAS